MINNTRVKYRDGPGHTVAELSLRGGHYDCPSDSGRDARSL